jgi:hypothetical protein
MHTSFAAAEAAAEAQLNSSRGQPGAAGGLRWSGLCSMSLGLAAMVMRRVPGYASLQPDPQQVWKSTAGGISALPLHCSSVFTTTSLHNCILHRWNKPRSFAEPRQQQMRHPKTLGMASHCNPSLLVRMHACSPFETCSCSCRAACNPGLWLSC